MISLPWVLPASSVLSIHTPQPSQPSCAPFYTLKMMRSTLLVVMVMSALLLTNDVAAWRVRGRRIFRQAAKIVVSKVASAAAAKAGAALLAGKRSEDNDCSVTSTFNGDNGEGGLQDAVNKAVEEFEETCQ